MLKKLLAIFKLGGICSVLTKITTALVSAISVVNQIKEAVKGSKIGDKVMPYLDGIQNIIVAIKNALDTVGQAICADFVPVSVQSLSADQALDNLKKIADDLNKYAGKKN